MNCTQIEKMLPLHVGGDLNESKSAQVREHLQHCASCNTLYAGFEESRNWLRNGASPNIDRNFLEDFRSDVLRQIARDNSSHRGFDPVKSWGWPAFAAILLLISVSIWFYLNRQPRQSVQRIVIVPNTFNQSSGKEIKNEEPRLSKAVIRKTPRPRRTIFKPAHSIPVLTNIADLAMSMPPEIVDIKEREMTRIEIQTADPNIRIIWLTPKDNGDPTNINNRTNR